MTKMTKSNYLPVTVRCHNARQVSLIGPLPPPHLSATSDRSLIKQPLAAAANLCGICHTDAACLSGRLLELRLNRGKEIFNLIVAPWHQSESVWYIKKKCGRTSTIMPFIATPAEIQGCFCLNNSLWGYAKILNRGPSAEHTWSWTWAVLTTRGQLDSWFSLLLTDGTYVTPTCAVDLKSGCKVQIYA